jgi:hypothetical protein
MVLYVPLSTKDKATDGGVLIRQFMLELDVGVSHGIINPPLTLRVSPDDNPLYVWLVDLLVRKDLLMLPWHVLHIYNIYSAAGQNCFPGRSWRRKLMHPLYVHRQFRLRNVIATAIRGPGARIG